MATSTVPKSGISLHGAPPGRAKDRAALASARSAIIVNLNEQVIRDLQQCSQAGKTVQLLGGKFPRIRYGSKLLDLNATPETFRHEIYSADAASAADLTFTGLVSYKAEIRAADKKADDAAAGSDAALAMLKQSLASAAQEKEARKVTISNNVIATGKGNKSLHPSRSLLNRAAPTSSSASTPRHAPPPTSAPPIDAQAKSKEKGMRTALVHLLAVSPATEDDISAQTRIPRNQLNSALTKIAEKEGSEWKLSNKYFKDIDPWDFKYPSEGQRQAAIDNAIRAYDRLRVPKDDRSWQILLPKEERGKGKTLSRLQLNAEKKDTVGTPGLTPVPAHNTPSTAGTPKLGPSTSTPRSGATATGRSGAGISVEKRLKEAQKKRQAEEVKMKKAQQKEAAAASDRESKPRNVTAKRVPVKKISSVSKSEEIVHSSDDEDEGEIKEMKPTKTSEPQAKERAKTVSKPKPSVARRESSSSEVGKPKAKTAMATDNSSRVTNAPYKSSGGSKLKTISKSDERASPAVRKPDQTTAVTKTTDTTTSAATPTQRTGNNPSASQSRQQQVSPRKGDTKPKVPSPLGTSQPIHAPGKSEKATKIAASKAVNATGSAAVANSKKAPKQPDASLNFFGGIKTQAGPVITKKRALDSADESGEPARKITKTTTNGTIKPAKSSSTGRANDTSRLHDHGVPEVPKHRKADSSSTHSLAPTNSSVTSLTTAATASPSPSVSSSGSPHDSAKMAAVGGDGDGYSSTRVKLSFAQALDEAEKFRTKMYPVYVELYERLDKTPAHLQKEEDVRTLWEMHRRLSMMKKEIFQAAE
ncbi:hypothetical protein MBLNU459_g4604t1 [Dothideomycetes sp. NU459]